MANNGTGPGGCQHKNNLTPTKILCMLTFVSVRGPHLLTFQDFVTSVRRTWRSDQPPLTPHAIEVLHALSGITGESGEIAEIVKKGLFLGQPHKLDRDVVCKELGDLLYYLTIFGDLFDVSLEEIAATNKKKLEARYPTGFVLGGGIREAE